MSDTILITGGLGYVGGRVATHLREARPGVKIIVTTRRSLQELPDWASGLDVRRMDLSDKDAVVAALEGIDAVIHLAAVNEIEALQDPLRALETNAGRTYALLDAAVAAGVKRFIYLSTYHVYDSRSGALITEESPARPTQPYAVGHLAAEGFVDYFRSSRHLQTLIFRLSNGYGYPMNASVNRWTLAFNDMCRQAVSTGKIVLRSSGRQHRDFISLEDVARAIDHFLFAVPTAWGDGLFNVGGECSMSVLGAAERVSFVYSRLFGKAAVPIIKAGTPGDEEQARPVEYEIGKLKRTGFSLKGDMDREIERTLMTAAELRSA